MAEADDKAPKKRGRKKGAPKTGGRQKGTRNRNSMTVLQALDKAGIPIIEFLIQDIQCLEPEKRINEWHRLLSFCYPRLKKIDFLPPALPQSSAPQAAPAAAPPTREERLSLIRGHVSAKPEAPG